MSSHDRRVLAILAADVVGYSGLMEADEAGTLARLKTFRSEVTDPNFAQHRGRIVKIMGDGLLVVFESVVDAVNCAAKIQQTAAERNITLPVAERIILRVGVNLGDVALVDGDVYGDGVNIAARVEQLCEPGGVMVSGTAFDHLQGKLSLPLDFVGEQQVKNITRPVRLYRLRLSGTKPSPLSRIGQVGWRKIAAALTGVILLAVAGSGIWWSLQPAPATAKAALAVLPFENYGGDTASERLADGLTEDIITDLARFREFDVVARNSTETYKGKAVDIREVAKALNVGYVLEGSIQRDAGRVRITAQLIDLTGNHLWSERWDRPVDDVFAVQTEIAQQVSNQLAGGAGLVRQAERDSARRKRPDNLSAYELYLLGSEKTEQASTANIQEAIKLLTRAVELDPKLARAWTSLFHAYDILAWSGVDAETSRKKAAEAAEHAVALDPNDADAHVALGASYGAQNDFVRAKAEFNTALRLAPGSARVLTQYANWAATFDDAKHGAELADHARKLDPNYPMWAAGRFAGAYFAADRYQDALEVLEPTKPDEYTPDIWIIRPSSLAALGKIEEAKTWVTEALKRFPDLTAEGWANEPSYSVPERERFLRLMSLAGFPPCAKHEVLSKVDNPLRHPECK